MAFDEPLKFKIHEQHVIESHGNSIVAFSKVAWGDNNPKYEIRRWYFSGDEMKPQKGVSFNSKETIDNLTELLVEQGYGSTKTILNQLTQRSDIGEATDLSDDVDMFKANEVLDNILGDINNPEKE